MTNEGSEGKFRWNLTDCRKTVSFHDPYFMLKFEIKNKIKVLVEDNLEFSSKQNLNKIACIMGMEYYWMLFIWEFSGKFIWPCFHHVGPCRCCWMGRAPPRPYITKVLNLEHDQGRVKNIKNVWDFALFWCFL